MLYKMKLNKEPFEKIENKYCVLGIKIKVVK